MHELSMANAIVSTVAEAVGDERVLTVRLRVGVLAGLVPSAMHFAWDLACTGSRLAGSRLEIEEVPVSVACRSCDTTSPLADPLPLRCPRCHGTDVALAGGQELEIGTVEVADDVALPAARTADERTQVTT